MDLWSIVLAGGSGRRLQAVTETFEGEPVPKQYCRFGRGRTLLQTTLDRAAPVVPPSRTIVVVDRGHYRRAWAQIGERPGIRLVVQPCDRGTAAGVLLPLSVLLSLDPEALLLLLPSDHAFEDEALFLDGVRRAERAVMEGLSKIVLLAVEPDAPRPDFGWIVPEGALPGPLRRVASFVEKPSREEAEELRRSGGVWNTMILVARARSILELFRLHLGDLCRAFALFGNGTRAEDPSAYRSLPEFDFSRDLLGRASGLSVLVWPRTVGWSDLGTPDRLYGWLARTREEAPR
jgi:mannose-1-phosphate guanylyltransferase